MDMLDTIRNDAAATEAAGRLAPSTVAKLVEAGSFKLWVPEDYGGAVGDFEVELFSGGEEVAVGQPFEVVLTIYGGVETNLAQVRAPVPSGLDGFHVQGVIETEVEQGRRFTMQLVPLRAGMTAVEGLTFVTYSPKSSSFARLGGEPVPVRVVPRRDGVALPEGIEELIRQDELARGGGGAWLRWVFVGLAAGGLGMFLLGMVVMSGGLRQLAGDALQRSVSWMPAC